MKGLNKIYVVSINFELL